MARQDPRYKGPEETKMQSVHTLLTCKVKMDWGWGEVGRGVRWGSGWLGDQGGCEHNVGGWG